MSEIAEPFKEALIRLIHRYSLEGDSDTPDFLLADYLVQCLALWNVAIAQREAWYGRVLHKHAAWEEPRA